MRRGLKGRQGIYVVLALVGVLAALASVYFIFSITRPRARERAREAIKREALPTIPPEELAAPVPPPRKVLESRLAGRWYDTGKDRLTRTIERYLDNVASGSLEGVHALILPHAGYRYSGQTAAYGVKQVAGRTFRRVIVMGPTHYLPMENVASLPDASHYATPLGEIPLDWQFMDTLKRYPMFKTLPMAHGREHSVQIELPLLQHALGEFRLVPMVVGRLDLETARAMAKVLLGLIDESTLVVASSDFTHYGPDYRYIPFRENVADNLRKLDMGAFEAIQNKDLEGFFQYLDETGATVCGACPIEVLLGMLPPEDEAHLLHYDTSGRMTNTYTNSVSYLSVAFTGVWRRGEAVAMTTADTTLSDEDKAQLLKLARETLAYVLEKRRLPAPEELDIQITPGMKTVMGAFVTIKKHGDLRGCIGRTDPCRPVYKEVMTQAINAGLNDRRFPAVEASELPELHFEISAYADGPRPIASYEDIVLGKHGIVLEKGGYKGLFLPQVATEQGWDLDETLRHLSLKAALPEDAWKEGASFAVFEAIVFGEETG